MTTCEPLVSVVLNSYNQGRFVRSAIESVLRQTARDFELLAIDNGSTDDSASILAEYEDDPRVRLVLHSENLPVSRRFNEAVAQARGDFVSFLYSDDYFLPTKLERQVTLLRSLPEEYGVVYGPAIGENHHTGRQWTYNSVGASGDVFAAFMLEWHRGQIDMCSPLTKRACLLEHRFDESVFSEGEGIFLRIALTHRFAYHTDPLAVLRDHGGNAGKAIRRNRDIVLAGTRRLRADPRMDASRLRLVDRYEASVLRAYAWQGARLAPDPAFARDCLIRAARISPRATLHPKYLAAAVLSVLPAGIRTALNRLGHTIRRHPGNPYYVDDYEGLVD